MCVTKKMLCVIPNNSSKTYNNKPLPNHSQAKRTFQGDKIIM